MSWQCVKWAIEETGATGPAYTVLLVLAESADEESGFCRIKGEREIATRAHIKSWRRIGDYLRELEREGLITIRRTPGRKSVYDLSGYTRADFGPTSPL